LGRVDTRPLLAHFTGHRDVPLLVDIDEQYPVIGRKRPGHGSAHAARPYNHSSCAVSILSGPLRALCQFISHSREVPPSPADARPNSTVKS